MQNLSHSSTESKLLVSMKTRKKMGFKSSPRDHLYKSMIHGLYVSESHICKKN